jgi:multicomponent Na+:H+ antiporter subunit G
MSAAEALSALSWCLLATGGILGLIGGIGLNRLPDFYTRTHASGMVDTFSAPLILVGLLLQTDQPLVAAKLILILVFLFFTSPTAGHALVRAALSHGLRPDVRDHVFAEDAERTGDPPAPPPPAEESAPSRSSTSCY